MQRPVNQSPRSGVDSLTFDRGVVTAPHVPDDTIHVPEGPITTYAGG